MSGGYIGTAPADRDPAVGNDTVGTSKIQDDAVTAAKLANSINTEIAANTAKVTNATHTGDVTGATALTIANDAVEQAMIADDAVGADQLASNAVVNASIASSAAIDATKIADGSVTSTEFQYINTLSSNAQTQLDAKPDLSDDQTWTGSQRGTVTTDNDGSFDQDGANNFFCTPSGNITLTFTNHTSGQSGYILLNNAGGHTISLHANTKGDANLAATLSTAGTYLVSYFDTNGIAYCTTSAVFA
ncbi:MAG: hypothetical protein GY893_01305 [bacterium]|nr:hypothetical protein [bacterium]